MKAKQRSSEPVDKELNPKSFVRSRASFGLHECEYGYAKYAREEEDEEASWRAR